MGNLEKAVIKTPGRKFLATAALFTMLAKDAASDQVRSVESTPSHAVNIALARLLTDLKIIEMRAYQDVRNDLRGAVRCLPAVRRLCAPGAECHMTDVFIALDEDTFHANYLDQFERSTIDCSTASKGFSSCETQDTFECIQVRFPHAFYSHGVPRRDNSGYYQPLAWFNDHNRYVQDAFNHTVFVAASGLEQQAAGHTINMQGEYTIVDAHGVMDPKATLEVTTMINFDPGQQSGPTGETNTLMHEIAHAVNGTIPQSDDNKIQFNHDIVQLLQLVQPCLATEACLRGIDVRRLESLVEHFLQHYDPLPTQVDDYPELRQFDPFASAEARRVFQDHPMSMTWHVQSANYDMRGAFGEVILPEVHSTYLPPNANFYRARAMISLLRFAEQIQRSFQVDGGVNNGDAGNSLEMYEAVIDHEPYSYLLGDGHVPPFLEYAYADLLTPQGLAWARGERCLQQEAVDRANPYINTAAGREELRQLFRAFWRFVNDESGPQ